MSSSRTAIWIQPAAPASVVREPSAPSLRGPHDTVQRVLHRLGRVVDPSCGRDIVSDGRIVSLAVDDDEATLTLRLGSHHCGSAHHVAEEAFDVLRAELPGLDLYLQHARFTPCA